MWNYLRPKYTIGRDPLHAASFNFPPVCAGVRGLSPASAIYLW